MIEFADHQDGRVRIKVLGVGNAGGMIVKRIAREGLPGVECGAVNTALKDLDNYADIPSLRIGAGFTRGHGAGMDPQIGRKAALEDAAAIRDFIGPNDLVFLVAGFGKGTGTGATPVIAELAHDLGALTVAFVTTPTPIETQRHHQNAEEGLRELKGKADAWVTLSNRRLFELAKLGTVDEAWSFMDETVLAGVRSLVDVLQRQGRMSYDLADLRTLLRGAGPCAFAAGAGRGEARVAEAARELAEYPFLDATRLAGAKSLLASYATGKDFGLTEIMELHQEVVRLIGGETTLAPPIWQDESLNGEVRVTLFVAGLAEAESRQDADELFPSRGLLRGGVFARAAGSDPRMPSAPEAGRPGEPNYDVPAFLRKPRNGTPATPRN